MGGLPVYPTATQRQFTKKQKAEVSSRLYWMNAAYFAMQVSAVSGVQTSSPV
jgi:hypothetical protein